MRRRVVRLSHHFRSFAHPPRTAIPLMRPIWKGSISFGLVYIPDLGLSRDARGETQLSPASRERSSPIKYKKVAEADMKEVPADEIVKGYEYERGHFSSLKDEDFEKVKIESTHSIDITDFVELGAGRSEILLQALFPRAAKRRRKSLLAAAQGAQRHRQNRHRQSRDQQPRTSRLGQTRWIVPRPRADAFR